MVQDFAKLRAAAAPDKAPPPAPANKTLLFTGLLTGLALGVFGSFLVYLSGVLPPIGNQVPAQIDASALASEQAEAQQRLNEDLERAAAQLQLEFYQELPNYEVIVNTLPDDDSQRRLQQSRAAARAAAAEAASGSSNPDDDLQRTIAELTGAEPVINPGTPSSNPTAALSTPTDPAATRNGAAYMIQAGAFQQEPAAIAQSNRLNGLGLEARVKKEALLGKTLFLVQAGPYLSREELSQVERILRTNNIDSMRITLGGL